MSDASWHLRDIDNRGDNGAPYEVSGLTLDQVIGYLNGPLRRDLVPHEHANLDSRIRALRDGWRPSPRSWRESIFGVSVWAEDPGPAEPEPGA